MHVQKYRFSMKLSIVVLICGLLLTGCVGSRFNPDGWAAPTVSADILYVVSQKNGEFLAVDLENPTALPDDLTPELDEKSASFFGCQGPEPELVGYATPVIANGVAYLADYQGKVYAVDLETGNDNVWREPVETDGTIVATPVVYDRNSDDDIAKDTLVVASDDKLYAIGTEDGALLWKDPFDADRKIWSNLVIDGGYVYFGTLHHKLYRVDLASGEGQVLRDFDGPVIAEPLIVDGVLYVGTLESKFYAIDIENGDLKWEFDEASDWFWSRAAYQDGTVYVGCRDKNVYAIDAETGELRWQEPVSGAIRSATVIVDGKLLVATKEDQGTVYAFDLESGQEAWRPIIVEKIYADPWVEGTTVYYLNEKDEIYAIDAGEGKVLWDISLDRD